MLMASKIPYSPPAQGTGRSSRIRVVATSKAVIHKSVIAVMIIGLIAVCQPIHSVGYRANRLVDVWVVPPFSTTPILPTDDLGKPPAAPVIQLVAVPGQTETSSFVIRADIKTEPITFKVTPLQGDYGVIESDRLQLRYVKTWLQADGAWREPRIRHRRRNVLIPELLVNDPGLIRVDEERFVNELRVKRGDRIEYIDITTPALHQDPVINSAKSWAVRDAANIQPIQLEEKRNQQLLVTFRVPMLVMPGRYRGAISAKVSREAISVSIGVQLEVLPFKLAPTDLLYGMYYRGQLDLSQASISSELKTTEQLTVELQDIADHGIAYPTIFQGNSNPVTRARLNVLRSEALLEAYLQRRRAVGFPTDRVFYLGIGAAGAAADMVYTRRVLGLMRRYGYRDIYFYGKDEAAGEDLKNQRDNWKTVHEMGGKVFAANNKHDVLAQGMADVLDIAIMAGELKPEEARKMRKHGVGRVLSYNRPQSAVENPAAFRKNYGYALIGAGYDGAMIYAYQHGFGSIWNDFDHFRFRDHCLTYPTENGVIGTLAWEALRAAIDDVRYYATFQRELARGEHDTSARWQSLRQEAAALFGLLQANENWEPADVRSRLIDLTLRAKRLQEMDEGFGG